MEAPPLLTGAKGEDRETSLTSSTPTQAGFQVNSRIGTYLVPQAPKLVRPLDQNHMLLTTKTDIQPRQSSEKRSLQGLKQDPDSLVSGTPRKAPSCPLARTHLSSSSSQPPSKHLSEVCSAPTTYPKGAPSQWWHHQSPWGLWKLSALGQHPDKGAA